MPREVRAWYRASRKMFFGLVQGKQVPLGISDPDKQHIAQLVLDQLRADSRSMPPPPQPLPAAPPARTVADLAAEFLSKRKPKVSPGCWRQYDITLRVHLVPAFGPRPANTLTAEELEDWAELPRPLGSPDAEPWSSSTRNNNLGTVQTFLKWAGFPLAPKRPPKESRGAEAVVSDEDFERLLKEAVRGNYAGDLRELLRVLRETGARPQEIAPLTAAGVDWANCCTRLRKHKTARKTGLERVIHFNTAAMLLLEAQRAKHPEGPLFRTRAGNAYSGPAIVKRMAAISKRLGVRAIAYGVGRHSFATKALCSGVPDTVVAAILGHTTTAMVHRNYGHVSEQARVLKAAVEQATARAG